MNVTRELFPTGTRVVGTSPGNSGLVGTVTGWAGSSIGVRWDNGGTSAAPASHGGMDLAPVIRVGDRVTTISNNVVATVTAVTDDGRVFVVTDQNEELQGTLTAYRPLELGETVEIRPLVGEVQRGLVVGRTIEENGTVVAYTVHLPWTGHKRTVPVNQVHPLPDTRPAGTHRRPPFTPTHTLPDGTPVQVVGIADQNGDAVSRYVTRPDGIALTTRPADLTPVTVTVERQSENQFSVLCTRHGLVTITRSQDDADAARTEHLQTYTLCAL